MNPLSAMDTSTPNGVLRHETLSSMMTVTPLSYSTLTPPSSEERKEHRDCTFHEPDLSSASDIVSEFYRRGFPILSQHIFSFLEAKDIANACLVCRSWRDIIHSLPSIRKRLCEYKARQRALGQENRPLSASRPTSTVLTPRIALSDLQNTSLGGSNPIKIVVESPFPNGVQHSHRPCPVCISPARIMSPTVARCLKCDHEFCQDCLRRSHSPKPCSRNMSPKRPASCKSTVISNKHTKKSRRRL